MSTDRSRRAGTDDADLDAHALLGTTPATNERDLRRAYRQALLRAHPDQGGDRADLEAVQAAFARLTGRVGARPVSTPSPESARATAAHHDLIDGAIATAPIPKHLVDLDIDVDLADPVGGTTADEERRGARPTATRGATVAYQTVASLDRPVAAPAAEPTRPVRRHAAADRFAAVLDRELVRRSGRRVRLVGQPA
ncbi:MAG: J domain-containing protein [Actinomycetota bacterium]